MILVFFHIWQIWSRKSIDKIVLIKRFEGRIEFGYGEAHDVVEGTADSADGGQAEGTYSFTHTCTGLK